MPYLDDELFDFLLGIPADVVVDRLLHDEAIAAGYPQFAHVPYEKKGSSKTSREYRRIAIDFLREAARRRALRFFDAQYLAATLGRELVAGRGQLWYVPKGLALLQAANAATSAAAR